MEGPHGAIHSELHPRPTSNGSGSRDTLWAKQKRSKLVLTYPNNEALRDTKETPNRLRVGLRRRLVKRLGMLVNKTGYRIAREPLFNARCARGFHGYHWLLTTGMLPVQLPFTSRLLGGASGEAGHSLQ